MSSTPAKSAGDARYAYQDPFIQSTLSHTISTPICIGVPSSSTDAITPILLMNLFSACIASPQISVSRGTHDLREFGGPVLEPGFILKGKMSILGIETTGAISLHSREVCLTASLCFYLEFFSPASAMCA